MVVNGGAGGQHVVTGFSNNTFHDRHGGAGVTIPR